MRQIIRIPTAGRQSVLDRVGRYLAALPAETAFVVEVKPYKRARSNSQNAYLWGVCYPTLLKAGGNALDGWDATDLHEYFLGEHFGWETISGFGRMRMKPLRRSSRLTTAEFADYVDFIQRKAAEIGVYIPDPNEEFAHED